MVKVGFWFDAPAEYSGGINYIRNLLYALSLVNDASVKPYIFFSSDIPTDIEAQFTPLATVVKTKLLKRGTGVWYLNKVFYKLFGSMSLVNAFLKSYDIRILSHVWFVYKGRSPFKIIGWIPDFQYLHLPELFPTLDIDRETRRNQRLVAQSEIMILSSYNALEDFKSITPLQEHNKARVLQFVSQPTQPKACSSVTKEMLEEKYNYQGKYFFLPNQFWAHKNHTVVLKAVKYLKDIGHDILVICTGNTQDLRSNSKDYFNDINEYIKSNKIEENFLILGQIDYDDVLALMRYSLAVINPSFFEGWSSSVEEAKSMGKPVILSNIGVHLEQNPQQGRFFAPDHSDELSSLLKELWLQPSNIHHEDSEKVAKNMLKTRTIEYGQAFLNVIKDVDTSTVQTSSTCKI